MNALGYQAMAVGNHEFDLGPAGLAGSVQQASFPVLSANLDTSTDPDLGGLIEAYTVPGVTGEKVGVFGLTTPNATFISSPGPNVEFGNATDAARAIVEILEGHGTNKIVALTHLGYGADQQLVAKVDGIDVIVGGHSHTPLGGMEGAQAPYPTVIAGPVGERVLVVTANDWGRYLGRLDVTFNADGQVEMYQGSPIFIDESVPEDAGVAADVAKYAEPLEELKNQIVAQSSVDLVGDRVLVRSQETNLADMICDAMLWRSAAADTQICILNGGAIGTSIPAGDVSMRQVLEVPPSGNQIATFGLKGSDVRAALEHGLSGFEEQAGAFPQMGGLRYTFDPGQPSWFAYHRRRGQERRW
jgi:5'-nucleotidase